MNIVVGGGKYGCYAIEYLKEKKEDFVVLDMDPNCLAVQRFKLKTFEHASPEGEYFMIGDLREVLELLTTLKPKNVFPTAPVHVAADLAKIRFKLLPWSEAIENLLPKLPEAVVLQAGKEKLVVSFNKGYECIDKCVMPKTCPTSGTTKPCTMTELMQFACPEAFILVSYSMAPGMGALKGSELLGFFKWANLRDKFVVATACDCHGVFSAFAKSGNVE